MSQLPDFPRVSGALALDFVNTLVMADDGPVDLLDSPARLSAWLRTQPGLPDLPDFAADLADLEAVRVLRAALRTLFEASMQGRPPPASALAAVNHASAGLATFPILAWSAATEPVLQTGSGPSRPAAAVLGVLAHNGIELLASPRRHQLHACQRPGCVLLFLASRPERRWCSTAVCGNRVRVARHFRRHHQASNLAS